MKEFLCFPGLNLKNWTRFNRIIRQKATSSISQGENFVTTKRFISRREAPRSIRARSGRRQHWDGKNIVFTSNDTLNREIS
jgi:hypothetical protein